MAREHRVAELVERFYRDAWNGWDDGALNELLAPGFVFRGSLGDEAAGRDGFRAYRDKIRRAFPDFHNDVRDLVVEGERAAARLLCSGQHEGELFGIPRTGARITYEAAAFFKAHDGYLAQAWVLGDIDGLRNQLNADPDASSTVHNA